MRLDELLALPEAYVRSLEMVKLREYTMQLQSASNKRIKRNLDKINKPTFIYDKLNKEGVLTNGKFSMIGKDTKEDVIKHFLDNKRFLEGISTAKKVSEHEKKIFGSFLDSTDYKNLSNKEKNSFWNLLEKSMDVAGFNKSTLGDSDYIQEIFNIFIQNKGKYKDISKNKNPKKMLTLMSTSLNKAYEKEINRANIKKVKDIFDLDGVTYYQSNDILSKNKLKEIKKNQQDRQQAKIKYYKGKNDKKY